MVGDSCVATEEWRMVARFWETEGTLRRERLMESFDLRRSVACLTPSIPRADGFNLSKGRLWELAFV